MYKSFLQLKNPPDFFKKQDTTEGDKLHNTTSTILFFFSPKNWTVMVIIWNQKGKDNLLLLDLSEQNSIPLR